MISRGVAWRGEETIRGGEGEGRSRQVGECR